MKTSLAQIGKIFRANLDERNVETGKGCPTPEDLVRLLTQGAGRRARAKIIGHVSTCADCAQVLRSILRLSEEIDKLTGNAGALKGCPQDQVSAKRGNVRPLIGRRAAIAILAGLIGLTIITFSVIRLTESPAVRGPARPQIRLFSPKQGASYSMKDIIFRWEGVPKAKHYSIELFDKSLAKIWRSGSLPDTATELPAEARGVVSMGGAYFCRVTAVLDDGEELLSRLTEFSIKK